MIPKRAFFYFHTPKSPENPGYSHLMIALGEGLKELGVELYSNRNHWLLLPSETDYNYLFQFDPNIKPDDCELVFVNHQWFAQENPEFPKHFFHQNRKYVTIFLDNSESMRSQRKLVFTPEFKQFDFIFRTHCSQNFRYPSNVYPWAFGLSNRILKEVKNPILFQERKKHLIVNFRHTRWMHSVRKASAKKFETQVNDIIPIYQKINHFRSQISDPYHTLMAAQTGKRHSPEYYKLLGESMACSCFGGFFVSNFLKDPSTLRSKIEKRLFMELGWTSHQVLQWDSWRFWESLASGCVGFHLDFDRYKIAFPVPPINFKHYIGIDLDNVKASLKVIQNNPEILESVSEEGRKWVIENYSPVPTAKRFLEIIQTKL